MYNQSAMLLFMFFAAAAQAQSAGGGVITPQPWGNWMQESGRRVGGESGFRCPDSQAMVGRQHQGDENGQTRYRCATVAFNGVSVNMGPASPSGWIQESGNNSGDKGQYLCPPNTVIVGRDHQGDENGNTRYWCAPINYEDAPLALRTKIGSGAIQESGRDSGGTSSYSCPANQLMVGRRHQGDENGYTWYLCADILWDHTPLVRSPPYQGAWMQESGRNSGGTSSFVCPIGYVMTGRIHKGDENGDTMYQCEQALYRGEPALTRNATWSDWIQESGKYTGGTSSYSCPASRVMTGRQHRGDENGNTRYRCASLFVKGSLAQIAPLDWQPWLQESGKKTHGESYFACGTGSFMVSREHKGDENGDTRYRCAAAWVPFNSATLASAYELASTKVGDPATRESAKFASRADMGLSNDYFLHVDIGGEGHHTFDGVVSGFAGAINVNAQTHDSQPPHSRIPSLIRVDSWTTSPPVPFKDGTVNYVTMQNAPLEDDAVAEFARILAPGGQVGLWIDMEYGLNNVRRLAQALQSSWQYSCSSGRQPCSNTCIDEFYDASDLDFVFSKVCIVNWRRN